MSKEIEEMAKVMCQDAGTKNCNIDCNAHPICDVYFYAERLYKEGYRKQVNEERKMQVKLIYDWSINNIENRANEFLSRTDIEVVEIKFNFRGDGIGIVYREVRKK